MDGTEEKIALHLYVRCLCTVCRIYYGCGLIVFFHASKKTSKTLSKNQDSRFVFELKEIISHAVKNIVGR